MGGAESGGCGGGQNQGEVGGGVESVRGGAERVYRGGGGGGRISQRGCRESHGGGWEWGIRTGCVEEDVG